MELLLIFFFQAEDDIRGRLVTGVQTCALPIWAETSSRLRAGSVTASVETTPRAATGAGGSPPSDDVEAGMVKPITAHMTKPERSEERRVGQECRSRCSPYH